MTGNSMISLVGSSSLARQALLLCYCCGWTLLLTLLPTVFAAINTTTTSNKSSQVENVVDVLILGGGISGLSAAVELTDINMNTNHDLTFRVLEAKNRWGGRLHTTSTTTKSYYRDDTTVVTTDYDDEMGGMYFHGHEHPIIQEIIHKYNLTIRSTGGNSMHPGKHHAIWLLDNKTLDEMQIAEIHELYDDWHQYITERALSLQQPTARRRDNDSADGNNNNLLLTRWTNEYLDNNLQNDTQRIFLKYQLKYHFDLDAGLSIDKFPIDGFLDAYGWQDSHGDDVLVVNGGMLSLIHAMKQQIIQKQQQQEKESMLLEHPITHIRYTSSTNNDHHQQCHVTTASGQVFIASRCIVTLPLAVLQQSNTDHPNSVYFDPPLDDILFSDNDSPTPIATLNTVIVYWNQEICDNDDFQAYYSITTDDNDLPNPLSHGFVCQGRKTQFHLSDTNHDFHDMEYWKQQATDVVMACTTKGQRQQRRHQSHDDENNHQQLQIVDIKISKWHLDPYARGSYAAISAPQISHVHDGTLYFAGEHTNDQGRFQSIDGAYATGKRAAKQVWQDLLLERHSQIPDRVVK